MWYWMLQKVRSLEPRPSPLDQACVPKIGSGHPLTTCGSAACSAGWLRSCEILRFRLTSLSARCIVFSMGYASKVQVIERAGGNRQFYLMCPAQLAEALELEKGEEIEWVVEDKHTLVIRRGKRERRREAGRHER